MWSRCHECREHIWSYIYDAKMTCAGGLGRQPPKCERLWFGYPCVCTRWPACVYAARCIQRIAGGNSDEFFHHRVTISYSYDFTD